mgnify:CR=1 FL=1
MATSRKDFGGSESYLSQIFYKYLPYWPLFVLFTVLSLGAAWYYLQHQTPLYKSAASVMINDQEKGKSESKTLSDLDPVEERNHLENEIEVLKSKALMTKVVKNLGLYAPVYEEGRFISKLAYQTSPVKVEIRNVDSLMGSDKLQFTYNAATDEVVMNNTRHKLGAWFTTPYGVMRFEKNPYFTEPAKGQLYFTITRPEQVAANLNYGLGVVPSTKGSAILSVSMEDENPMRAANIVNELLSTYNENIVLKKNQLAASTLDFVEGRLSNVKHDLDSIERKIERIKAAGAVDISAQGSMYLSNVNANDQKLTEVNTQLSILNSVEGYVLSKRGQGGIVPSALGVSDPILSNLLNKMYDLELQYERLRQTTGENNPQLTSITDQINKIKPNILENIQNQRRDLQAKRNSLYANNSTYNGMLAQVPQKEKELLTITREQANKSTIYNFLSQKKEEASLSTQSLASDSEVIDKAVPLYSAIAPNPRRIYLLSVLAAIGLCVSLIVGNETFSRKVLYRQDIEGATTFPVIGEIGYSNTKDLLISDIKNPKETFIANQFRKLRTSLTFLGIGTKRKRIIVTSSIPGEGKSFIVANLGLSLAIAGKKTIVLELDLLKPTLAKKLYVSSENGATEYLRGEMNLQEAIKPTSVNENLFILPAGSTPENPSELLMTDKVPQMLAQLEQDFDFIIIDTAPVGPLSDAYVLSSYCDATLYVVRHKYTPKMFVNRIDDENRINELKNTAIVFNAVKNRGFGKFSYGYGYGYGYSYGYGYGQPASSKPGVSKEKKALS